MSRIYISGSGWAAPPNLISNDFFERLDIGTTAEWIEQRTGIKSRYSVLDEQQLSALRNGTTVAMLRSAGEISPMHELADRAWQNLQASYPARDQGSRVIISGTSVPDFDIPASAAIIAHHLGITAAAAFDVNSACSSFVADLLVASKLLQSNAFQCATLFNVERYTMRMDYSDRRSSILFGDGAAVTELVRADDHSGLEVVDCFLESDPEGHGQVVIPVDGCFWQNGAAVQRFAITRTCDATRRILERNKLSIQDVRYFIGHQANLRMLQSACAKLGLAQEQHLYNIDVHGNQGGAGAPTVLAQNAHRFEPGDLVVVTVVGSGLSWGSALLRYHG